MRFVTILYFLVAGGLVSLPAVTSATPVQAAGATWLAQQSNGDAANPDRSREAAARRAKEQYGGRVLSVKRGEDGWRVRLLDDGQVRTVIVR
jgi:hypothetical protein